MKATRFKRGILTTAMLLFATPVSFGQVIYPPGVAGPPVLPVFDPAAFTASTAINNPYFPLAPGSIYNYRGETDEGEIITSRMIVTPDTRSILGVQTRVVRATEWVDGVLAEDTFDWFAQDATGNVWYFGEFTTAFEYDDEGNLTGTSNEGSWEAGTGGAQASYFMLADPDPGDHYYLEFFPGQAEDEAVVFDTGVDVSIDSGDFSDVLTIYETTALDPTAREFKYYAPGLGLILIEEDLNEELTDPQFTMELVGAPVIPEPMSLSLAAIGVGGLAWIRRRRR